jgi:hypothetical protein
MNIFANLKNFLITVLNAILVFLPNSPFTQYLTVLEDSQLLKTLNWIVPIGTFITIGETWLTAVTIFYIYSVILRWVKAIE